MFRSPICGLVLLGAMCGIGRADPFYLTIPGLQLARPFAFPSPSLLQSSSLSRFASTLPLQDSEPTGLYLDPDFTNAGDYRRTAFKEAATVAPPPKAEAQPAADVFLGKGQAVWNDLRGVTATGEQADPDELTAGHRTLPLGSKVRVVNLRTHQSVSVRINDRGPVQKKFAIDLTKASAAAIGLHGVAPVALYLEERGPEVASDTPSASPALHRPPHRAAATKPVLHAKP